MAQRKTVLITGCSSGFGYLTALKFAREGWQTFASVRDLASDGVKKLQEIKEEENLSLEILVIDVNDERSVQGGVERVGQKTDRIDVLVNNAGFGFIGPVEEFSIDEVKEQYETNVFGVLRMIKAVVPLMRGQRFGMIINLSSISGRVVFPLYGVYSSSKFAVEALSESLRFELKPFGVNVVLVEPGSFKTGFDSSRQRPQSHVDRSTPYQKLTDRFWSRLTKPQAQFLPQFLRRGGDPQEVVDLIYQVARNKNPRSRYLVGGDAHLYYLLRKVLPDFVWEFLLRRLYQW